MDSPALFTVTTRGNDLLLAMNSSHGVFADHPMPFVAAEDGDYKALVELLLEAWALCEDGAPAQDRRRFEDARMMWGRRMIQLLAETE